MKIQLYYNKSEPRTVQKMLEKLGDTLSGDFRDAVDIMSPSIRINGDAIAKNCNYLYIEELDRYYYVISIVSERNNTSILNCKLDVLYTYKTSLLKCYGLIDRAENGNDDNDDKKSYNRYVYDNKFIRESANAIIHLPFDLTDAGTLGVQSVLLTTFGATPVPDEP